MRPRVLEAWCDDDSMKERIYSGWASCDSLFHFCPHVKQEPRPLSLKHRCPGAHSGVVYVSSPLPWEEAAFLTMSTQPGHLPVPPTRL